MAGEQTGQAVESATETKSQKDNPYDYGGRDDFTEGDEIVQPTVKEGETEKTDETAAEKDARGEEGAEEGTRASGDEKKETEQETAAGPLFTPELVAKGQALGMTVEDFQAIKDNDDLGRVVGIIERRSAGAKKDEAPVKAEDQKKEGEAAFALKLDPEVYSPEVIAEFKRLTDYFNGQVSGLQGQLKAINDERQVERNEAFAGWFDEQVAGLGEEFKGVLGEKPGYELELTSQEVKNRQRVLERMDELDAGRRATGRRPLSDEELFKQALASAFPDAIKKGARQEVAAQLTKRKRLITAAPTSREGGPDRSDPRSKAVRAVREKLAEFGAGEAEEEEATL